MTLAVGCPKSLASVCRRHRRSAMPIARCPSAASCSRREAVIVRWATSAMTAPKPPCRSPSSKQASSAFSSPASTWISLSGASPACASAGAKRSERVTHQRTLPRVRAAMPAVNRPAAAPSTAPFPPPATSCKHPTASPPPGRRLSISARPNGRTARARRRPPSRRSMRSRRLAIAGLMVRSGMANWRLHALQ